MDVQSGAIKGPQQADASPQATSPIAAGEGTGTGTSNGHEQSAEHSHKHGMKWLTIEYRLYGVILIAACFLVAELVIGFTNNALVLVADAFHITSDLIGYVVSVVCIRLAQRGRDGKKDDRPREGFSFGWQRAEILGAAFNGVFLLALGVSVILQSVDRFINPSELTNPILVAIIGAAGIGSNFLMVLLLGGHNHSHGHGTPMDELTSSGEHVHADHAHYTRSQPKKSRFNLNLLGVLLHILGDAINSLAVIISAVVYLKTGWIYMDPLASLFVGFMIIGTALPLTLRSGRMLAEAAPKDIDLKGVRKDVAALEGVEGVHELHVWSLSQSKAIAALHLTVASDSLTAFMALSRKIQSCLHYWGLHAVTIQPEFVGAAVARNDENDEVSAITPPRRPSSLDAEASACRMRCPSQLCDEACC